MKIGFDFDDVLNDLSKCWVKEMNRRYGLKIEHEKMTSYHLNDSFPQLTEQQLYEPYLDGTLYLDINPVPEAQQLIAELSKTDELFVVTSNIIGVTYLPDFLWNQQYCHAPSYMLQFLWQYYPEIDTNNLILTKRKQLLKLDVLVDDNPANLQSAYYTKILLDAPYNRSYEAELHNVKRAYNYDEVRQYIEECRP